MVRKNFTNFWLNLKMVIFYLRVTMTIQLFTGWNILITTEKSFYNLGLSWLAVPWERVWPCLALSKRIQTLWVTGSGIPRREEQKKWLSKEGEYFMELLTTFSYFWLLLATFGYFWLLLATFGSFWLLLAPFGYFWLLWAIFGLFVYFLLFFGLILATYLLLLGYVSILLATLGKFTQCLILFWLLWADLGTYAILVSFWAIL
jgi:hypothetical protein